MGRRNYVAQYVVVAASIAKVCSQTGILVLCLEIHGASVSKKLVFHCHGIEITSFTVAPSILESSFSWQSIYCFYYTRFIRAYVKYAYPKLKLG